MSKTVVSSDNAPAAIGPYSPGIQTGNMAFLSGQLGIDPATGKMPEGVEAQAKQSLANVEALLTAAGVGTVIHSTETAYEFDTHPHPLSTFAARLTENLDEVEKLQTV